jgi:hypothetical protein
VEGRAGRRQKKSETSSDTHSLREPTAASSYGKG